LLLEKQVKEAEKLFLLVMVAIKAKLGADHPLTITAVSYLASAYRDQRMWEEATVLDLHVMKAKKSKLDDYADH
jgi:hypothetical protein